MVRGGYTFSNGKCAIMKLCESSDAYRAALDKSREKAKWARENFADNAEWISGWAHNFGCPRCSAMMTADLSMPYNAPNVFTCPVCGEHASSKDHDEAWVYFYRSRYGALTYASAVSAIMGDTEALDFLIRYLDFYADNYEKFEVHGKHAGKGKIMEQALDEAVWTIDVLSSLNACGSLIPEEKRIYWRDKLFLPITELIMPQADRIHNIPTWLMCATGAIGIYFGIDELLDHALNSTFGLRRQIEQGFTADGIWYEGSMTYHYYTASALSGFFSFYAALCPDDPIFESYARIYTAPLTLSYDGRHLSALNDGWYPNSIPMSLIASRITGDGALISANRELIDEAPYEMIDEKTLLFGLVESDFVLMAATRLAVIKKPLHVILKAGVIANSHMHRDCLSTRIAPFSEDLGTPGYGHVLTKEWYRFGAAHNAVCVDLAQPTHTVETYMTERNGAAVAGVAGGAWADLELAERSVSVSGDEVIDLTELKAPTEHTYDWIFHSRGTATYSCDAECEVESLGEGEGYQYITDIRKMRADGGFEATFTLADGQTLALTVPETDGLEVYVAKSPDNPANNMRSTVILRRRAKEARFRAVFGKKNNA